MMFTITKIAICSGFTAVDLLIYYPHFHDKITKITKDFVAVY